MQLDQTRDALDCWDNTESITQVSTRNTGDMTDTVRNVRRHQVSVREAAASFGAYTAGDVLFYLPRQMLSEALGEPKPGDVVYDDAQTRYTVLTVDHRRRDGTGKAQTYKLQCRDLRVAYALEDLVTIETPNRSLDASGAKVLDWATRYSLLPAKVQAVGGSISEERGIRGGAQPYTVIVDRQVTVLLGEDRVKWLKGLVYSAGVSAAPVPSEIVYLDIVGVTNQQVLGDLPVLQCEARP